MGNGNCECFSNRNERFLVSSIFIKKEEKSCRLTRRYFFNDHFFCNCRMESTGRPEQVHISEQTCSFLGDNYFLDEGEDVEGL